MLDLEQPVFAVLVVGGVVHGVDNARLAPEDVFVGMGDGLLPHNSCLAINC